MIHASHVVHFSSSSEMAALVICIVFLFSIGMLWAFKQIESLDDAPETVDDQDEPQNDKPLSLAELTATPEYEQLRQCNRGGSARDRRRARRRSGGSVVSE